MRTFHRKTLSALFATAFLAIAARADVVILKNGERLEGDVKRRAGGGWTVVDKAGKATDVAADSVKTIEVGGGKSPSANAAENLGSLRRSAEAITVPSQALERYRRFVEMNKGTPAADDAQKDIALWQDRLDRGLSRVGAQWVTAEQRTQLIAQAGTQIAQATELLRNGKTHDADVLLQQALDADPANPAGQYLRGVMLYAQDQVLAARKAFDATSAVLADHAPTLNNLAVVQWRQNQQIAALVSYDQGITAAPLNRILLDNVAEALAALPDAHRKSPVAARLFKHFAEQDAQLQEIMSHSGFHRWGATWVDSATLDRLKTREKEIKDTIDKLTADTAAARARMAEIDKTVQQNNTSMSELEANTYVTDSNNKQIRLPLPSIYYQLQNDNAKMTAERATLASKVQTMAESAKAARQSMPVPQFTGVQHLIGAEGTPLPRAASQPASQPTTKSADLIGEKDSMTAAVNPLATQPTPVHQPATNPSTGPTPPRVLIPLP